MLLLFPGGEPNCPPEHINFMRHYSFLDHCLIQLDQGLRTVFGQQTSAQRMSPAEQLSNEPLTQTIQKQSAALMRINHTGEVSAQALYHAQTLTARSSKLQATMREAGLEENDHLAWCQQRLNQLNAHTSYLNPLWYTGSFMIGICAGLSGDRWSLGFLAETERQVVRHLEDHLARLDVKDEMSRAILIQMREDEAHHATTACTAGAAELPLWVKSLMRGLSKCMTTVAYWV